MPKSPGWPRSRPRRAARSLALLALLGALAIAPAASAETWVGYQALLAQARSGPLIRAIVNPARHDVEIKFRDLSEWHAVYPPAQQGALERLLAARQIRTIFVPRPHTTAKPAGAHHHLRYIAAAVLGVCLLAGGGGYLLWRRRAIPSLAR